MFTKMTLERYRPKKLIIFSRDEMKQWEMAKNLQTIPVYDSLLEMFVMKIDFNLQCEMLIM